MNDIGERKRSEKERDLLARELSHRVKNTLAMVQSLAMHTDGHGAVEIERACDYEPGGSVELDYAPRGLVCELVFHRPDRPANLPDDARKGT